MSDAFYTRPRSSSASLSESKRAFESEQRVDIRAASCSELDSHRASAPSTSTEDYYRCDETLSQIQAVGAREIKTPRESVVEGLT